MSIASSPSVASYLTPVNQQLNDLVSNHVTPQSRKLSYDANYEAHKQLQSNNTDGTMIGTQVDTPHPAATPSSGFTWLDALIGTSYATQLATFHCSGVCPHESCALAVLRGLRQGIVYGAKVRFPHALVMTFLFRKGPIHVKVKDILNATYQHSWNLGRYVALFKLLECGVRHVRQTESGANQLIAGFIAGAVMFGTNTPINSQINMYVMSRVIFGLARLSVRKGYAQDSKYVYPLYAATIWALVMYLFEQEAGTLQGSLQTSMEYLYHGSNTWPKKTTNVIDWLIE